MKRLLTSTTALSLAFAPISPLPLAAQVAVETDQGSAICLTAENDPCPDGEVCFLAEAGDCAAEGIGAEADAALQASGGAPGLVPPGLTEEAAPEAADAEPEAAPEPMAEEAQPEASPEVIPDAASPEAASEPAPEAPAADDVAGEEPVEAEAVGEVAEPAPEAEAGNAAETAGAGPEEATGSEEAAGEAVTETAPEAVDSPEAEATTTATEPPEAETTEAEAPEATPDTAAETPETATAPETAGPAEGETAPPAEGESEAAQTDPQSGPADAQAPIIGEAATVLQDILGIAPDDEGNEAPAAAAASPAEGETAEGEAPAPAAAADVSETEITEENTRSSDEEFATNQTATAGSDDQDEGMSDLARFGLAALGALAVGAVLKNGDRVLSNTGDRVVIEDDRGEVRVLKDDDTLLRRPGSRLQTETFSDGSTRSTLNRDDGSSIVTIRDATGRVLRRARYAPDGTELVLIDDLRPIERIDVATLPPPPAPRDQTVISTAQDAGDLARALAEIEARDNARTYSLRQIRDYREVRALAPTIDVESITFRTGSAAIDVSEAEKLSQLGDLIGDVLAERPYEIFLIEGHTDAVGSAASNLALSDRRAESLALALTEYFSIPPENLVVQGYGESELRISTQTAEERNRRAAVRLISPLMRTAALR